MVNMHWRYDRCDDPEVHSASGTLASARVILKAECPVVAPTVRIDLRDGPKALSAMGAPWAIPTVECPEVTTRRRPAARWLR